MSHVIRFLHNVLRFLIIDSHVVESPLYVLWSWAELFFLPLSLPSFLPLSFHSLVKCLLNSCYVPMLHTSTELESQVHNTLEEVAVSGSWSSSLVDHMHIQPQRSSLNIEPWAASLPRGLASILPQKTQTTFHSQVHFPVRLAKFPSLPKGKSNKYKFFIQPIDNGLFSL